MDEVTQLLAEGLDLLDGGDYKKAFKRFKSAIDIDPESSEAYFNMAEASLGLPGKKIIEIASWYRKSIDLDPENTFYRVSYAEFCLENGIFKAATEEYDKTAELDPDNAQIYFNDYAISFYRNARKFPDRVGMSEDEIIKHTLEYYLKAMEIDSERAVNILKA